MLPEIIFVECLEPDGAGAELPVLSLPFERRQIARQRVTLSDGREAGLKLSRGTVLRQGHKLRSAEGLMALVQAEPEQVSLVRCDTAQSLAQAAYHLGNRHVWVQVGPTWLRYLHDHVLDDMLVGLGMSVESELAAFEPEAGAYSASADGTHTHGAGHAHSH